MPFYDHLVTIKHIKELMDHSKGSFQLPRNEVSIVFGKSHTLRFFIFIAADNEIRRNAFQ